MNFSVFWKNIVLRLLLGLTYSSDQPNRDKWTKPFGREDNFT